MKNLFSNEKPVEGMSLILADVQKEKVTLPKSGTILILSGWKAAQFEKMYDSFHPAVRFRLSFAR